MQPIYISGFNKSGTTLFLALLDDHDQLVVFPEELHFLGNMIFSQNRIKTLKNNTGFKLLLDNKYIENWTKGKSWFKGGYPEFDSSAFLNKINKINKKTRPGKLLDKVISAFADVIDKKNIHQWVSKTTEDEIFFPIYQKMYKDKFQFFYIVRDPRDVFFSYSKRAKIRENNINQKKFLENFTINWKIQVSKATAYMNRHPNFHIIKFEDLISHPEKVLKQVAQTIGIKFNDSLLIPSRLGYSWEGNSVTNDKFSNISSKPVGRYKDNLSAEQISSINCNLEKELKKLGYIENDDHTDNYTKKHSPTLRLRIKYAMARIIYKTKQIFYYMGYSIWNSMG